MKFKLTIFTFFLFSSTFIFSHDLSIFEQKFKGFEKILNDNNININDIKIVNVKGGYLEIKTLNDKKYWIFTIKRGDKCFVSRLIEKK